MRSVSRLRRRAPLAAVAATVSIATILAGCGTSGNGDSSNSPPLPGVTATSIKLGWSVVDIGTVAASLGFKQPNYGGFETQSKAINAIVADINKNGGMGGRQVEFSINRYLGANDSPSAAEAQCKGFTQDKKVTAAIIDGGFQNNTIPCFAGANTLVMMQATMALDQAKFEQHSPYLWSPTNPEYSGFMKAQLTAMKDAGFFEGNTGVLLMPSDDEVSRRTTDKVVKPYLESIGVTKMQASYIDSSNTGTLGATASQALNTGKNAKLNRVLVIGGARIEPVALSDQAAVGYDAKWGVASFDNPIFTQNNGESIVETARVGMAGLGYAPTTDVSTSIPPAFPDPTNPAQKKCIDVVTAAGAAPPSTPPEGARNNWKNAFLYCDAAYFLKAALDLVPKSDTITGAQFKEAVGKIGTTYRSSMTFGSQWGPNVYAGTNTAQRLAWNEACSCFQYSGEPVVFGAGAAGAGSSATQSVDPGAPGSVPLETVTIAP